MPDNIATTGLTLVSSGGDDPSFDIVFVHGLQGHPEHTWTYQSRTDHADVEQTHWLRKSWKIFQKSQTNVSLETYTTAKPPCFWPRDLLAYDQKDARIFTYGYDSKITKCFGVSPCRNSITKNGNDFLHALSAARGQCRGRPLMIVAHSLGGILVKSALRIAGGAPEGDQDSHDILDSKFAVLFFGTPHRGSLWANAGETASRFASALGFSVNTYNLRLLDKNSEVLQILRGDFRNHLDDGRFSVTSFQEELSFRFAKGRFYEKIVDDDSAGVDHKYEKIVSVYANHQSMVRFDSTGKTYQEYAKVLHEINSHRSKLFEQRKKNLAVCLLSLEQSYNALEVRFQEIDHAYHETYHWLLEDGTSGPGLARRLRAETGIFWIQGLPGSGKSTCMKWIYENPTTRSILDAAGFSMVNVCFTDRKSDVERSWRTVLASMLYQILRDREVLLELVEPFGCAAQTPLGTPTHPAAGQPTETIFYDWTINNLQEALMKCKEQTELPFKLCFFIDALDESDESVASAHAMVHFLDRLVSKKGDPGTGLIKVCTASRPETELEDLLHYRSTFQMQDWTGHDIRRFVTTKLQAICDTPHVVTTERDWNELHQLEEEIIQEARGVFLWVRLVVEYISDRIIIGTPVNEVREKVGRIPNDQISHFFRHMLEKIRGPETKIEAYVMLEAVRRARKPLTLTELALTVRTDKCRRLVHKADFEVELQPTDLLKGSESGSKFEKKIRQATKGLLQIHRKPDPRGVTGAQRNVLALESDRDKETIDPNTCTVQLMHQTVKEFLEEYHYGPALGYWTGWTRSSPINIHSEKAGWPNVWYERLGNHAAGRCIQPWHFTFLAFAVGFGMERYVSEKLAQDKSRLNETFRRPLLHYTAYCNKRKPNLGMAKILLDHDADVNNVFRDRSQPGESKTALESMDFSFPQDEGHSHTSYIRLLVEAGATLPGRIPYHGRPNDWRTVLHQIMEMPMASTPKLEMVKLFHDHGVSLEEKNSAGETVFEKIFRRNIRVPVEDAICMLEHGAKVQPWMVQQIYQPNNMHPLKDPNCRKPEYYTEAAREAALVHNQDWNLT